MEQKKQKFFEMSTEERMTPRKVIVKFRRTEKYKLKPEYESLEGKEMLVYMPFIVDSENSVYSDEICWMVKNFDTNTPIYLSEEDFIWID